MNKFRNNKNEQGRPQKLHRARKERGGGGEKEPVEKPGRAGYKAKRSFTKNKSFRENKETRHGDKPKRKFGEGAQNGSFKKSFGKEKSYNQRPERGALGESELKGEDRPKRKFEKSKGGLPFKREYKNTRRFEGANTEKKRDNKPEKKWSEDRDEKRYSHKDFEDGRSFSKGVKHDSFRDKKAFKKASAPKKENTDGLIRLNKYLSNAGIASRREADNLIQSGTVKVNGVVVDQLGYKIKPGDKVTYGDAAVKSERKVYLLLNKPKDYITTVDDPQERKTVMELIKGACRERIYPVGRLDRNTTGLLLFTNDGELTTKLTHPKFGIKKVYHVSLNKGLKPEDFKTLTEGVELEDGFVKADDLAFVGEGKKEVGIEIHSGRNRIVRRIFEHLGYDVIKLDRVVFAGLTKKDLPRGKHRFLTAKEVSFLQMLG